jgi:DNA (cytosine-5)-methyltransferase 1
MRAGRLENQRVQTNPPMNKPLAIDLFSGCGGLTLGLKQAGFRVLGAVEIDPLSRSKTYKANHGGVLIWPDSICKLSAKEFMRLLELRPGQLDLLAGCPPCQGFSRMTTLNGRVTQDARNDLIFEFLRFVRVFRPKAVMLENVPKLAKNRRARELRSALRKLGYKISCDVLDAADFGVPQRRKTLHFTGRKVCQDSVWATRPSQSHREGCVCGSGRQGQK